MMSDPALPQTDAQLWERVRQHPAELSRGADDYVFGAGSVDLATGRFAGTLVDLDLPGTLPLRIQRSYRPEVAFASTGGSGWAWLCDSRLILGPAWVVFIDADGAAISFDTTGGGPFTCVSGPLRILAETRTGFQIMGDRSTMWHFAAPEPTTSTAPVSVPLEAITDRRGNRIRLVRSADGTVDRIDHSAGIQLIPHWRAESISAFDVHACGDPFTVPISPGREVIPHPEQSLTATSRRSSTGIQRVVLPHPDGTRSRMWFDPDGTLCGWQKPDGAASLRFFNAHRQTVTFETTDESGSSQVQITRDPIGHPVSIRTATRRWLLGYSYPGCVSEVSRETAASAAGGAHHRTVVGSARWVAPDVPGGLTVGAFSLEFTYGSGGALTEVIGSFGTARITVDPMGLPVEVHTADGHCTSIHRDHLTDTVRLLDEESNGVSLALPLPGSSCQAPEPVRPSANSDDEIPPVLVERFPGGPALALCVGGRRLRLDRTASGGLIGVAIEETGTIVGAAHEPGAEADCDDGIDSTRLHLGDFSSPAGAASSGESRIPLRQVIDSDTGDLVGVLDNYAEVSVVAALPAQIGDAGSEQEWIHPVTGRWTGRCPAQVASMMESPEFCARLPSRPWRSLVYTPLLVGPLADVGVLRTWLADLELICADPGAAVSRSLRAAVDFGSDPVPTE